ADHLACVVHYHHSAVVEIRHTLVVLFAFLQDEDFHDLARQHDWLQRVGQLIDVQHLNALKLRDFVQVEIVSDDLGFVSFGKLDQLHVYFADAREIVFYNLHGERGNLLDALQDIETSPAAIALQRISGISHELQLAQHKLRKHNDAVEEAGFSDVGDATVNDDAGIQNFVALAALLLAAEYTSQRRQIQQVTFVGAHDQANIGHQHHDKQLQKMLGVAIRNAAVDDQAEQVGAEDSGDAANHCADQALEADAMQARFKQDHG